MKEMSCAAMGGPADCTTMIAGNTPEEMVGNGMTHITATHPDIAKQVQAMSKEDTTKWMAEFQPKFAALPEM